MNIKKYAKRAKQEFLEALEKYKSFMDGPKIEELMDKAHKSGMSSVTGEAEKLLDNFMNEELKFNIYCEEYIIEIYNQAVIVMKEMQSDMDFECAMQFISLVLSNYGRNHNVTKEFKTLSHNIIRTVTEYSLLSILLAGVSK